MAKLVPAELLFLDVFSTKQLVVQKKDPRELAYSPVYINVYIYIDIKNDIYVRLPLNNPIH